MILKDNITYWKISLNHLEPVQDNYYIFDDIIIDDEELIRKVERLRELIISYCVLIEKETNVINEIFDEIYDIIISIEKIQYHEFIAFWKVLDISYSVFKKLPNRKELLKEILLKYCQRRRKLYDKMGYSNIIVQALYDFGASRKKGSASNYKLIDLIKQHFKIPVHAKSLSDLENNDLSYCLPDRGDKTLFNKFCNKYNIKYEFGIQHQGKILDLILKVRDQVLLIEAKHMKEGGGAQDKQVVELIDFIKYSENSEKIHYVAFMDGVYFNRYAEKTITSNKTRAQKESIINNLNINKYNFFVNTAGLISILEDLAIPS